MFKIIYSTDDGNTQKTQNYALGQVLFYVDQILFHFNKASIAQGFATITLSP